MPFVLLGILAIGALVLMRGGGGTTAPPSGPAPSGGGPAGPGPTGFGPPKVGPSGGGSPGAGFTAGHSYQLIVTVPYPITTPASLPAVQSLLDYLAPGAFYARSVDAVDGPPAGEVVVFDCLKTVTVPGGNAVFHLGLDQASVQMTDLGATGFNA